MKYLLFLFCSSFYHQVLHHQILSSQRKTGVLTNRTNIYTNINSKVLQEILKTDMLFSKYFNKTFGLKYIPSPINLTDITTVTYPCKLPLLAVLNFTLLGFIESQFKTIFT